MTQPATGFVEILARDGGKLLAQSTTATSQSVTLTQPSLINIHASPAAVLSYQQQGNDLILQMRDGSVVRYRHFFSVENGEQSELLFVDGSHPPQHALFASGLQSADQVVTLTPSWQSVSTADTLLAAAPQAESSGSMTAMGLGLLGLAGVGGGVALAASHHSGSDDEANTAEAATTAGTTQGGSTDSGASSGGSAVLTVTKFTGDGVLSADERLSDQQVSGTSSNIASGSTLTVTLNGQSYSTQIASDGSWSVTLPSADLQALPDGSNTLSVSFPNASGGTSTANKTITVEPLTPMGEPPHPTIDQPFGDGILNAAEQATQQTLSGTTGATGSGQKVVVTLGEESVTASVDNDGNWSLSPDPYLLYEMGQGEQTITVTATDGWGQQGSSSIVVTFDTIEPRIYLDDISSDNVIDASESNSDLLITGSATLSEAGRDVDLLFNGVTYQTQVNSSGDWSLTIPASALQGLSEGVYSVKATLSDAAGNSSSASHNITLATSEDTLPTLTVDPISEDDAVSYREGIYGLEIWGGSSHLPRGTEVTLNIGDQTFHGNVGGQDGIWRVMLSDSELATIADGKYTFTFSATDPNGNSTSATRDVLLLSHYTSKIGFTVNDVTPEDISVVDGQQVVTISGTFADTFPINLISIMVEDYPYYDAVLTEDGHWSATVPLSGSNLTDGVQSIMFGTSDGAGNWVEQFRQIHVDLGHSSVTTLDLAALGLSSNQTDLADIAAQSGAEQESGAPLLLADSSPVTLSSTEGGVWSQPVSRTVNPQDADSAHLAAAGSESTLADLLAQQQLQVHVA